LKTDVAIMHQTLNENIGNFKAEFGQDFITLSQCFFSRVPLFELLFAPSL
jgi:hypothetical protein